MTCFLLAGLHFIVLHVFLAGLFLDRAPALAELVFVLGVFTFFLQYFSLYSESIEEFEVVKGSHDEVYLFFLVKVDEKTFQLW